MAVVTFKIAGRPYKIACNDGQENQILQMAEYVNQKAEALIKNIGFIPEGQLLAMVCILLVQDLNNARQKFQNMPENNENQTSDADTTAIESEIETFALRIAELTKVLKAEE